MDGLIAAYYPNIYLFNEFLAENFAYGYDTNPAVTGTSTNKDTIIGIFKIPTVRVTARRSTSSPKTDEGDQLTNKPQIIYSNGFCLYIPPGVCMDIGLENDAQIVEIKFKKNNTNVIIRKLSQCVPINSGQCITLVEDYSYGVGEINYLLNPKRSFIDKTSGTQYINPIYSPFTRDQYQSVISTNPVPVYQNNIGPNSDLLKFCNLYGYGIGTKELSGVCYTDTGNQSNSSFGYKGSSGGSAYGLFTSANTKPTRFNFAHAPLIIYVQNRALPSNGKICKSYTMGSSNPCTVTVTYTDNTSDTYTLQDSNDYFVEYTRTATSTGYFADTSTSITPYGDNTNYIYYMAQEGIHSGPTFGAFDNSPRVFYGPCRNSFSGNDQYTVQINIDTTFSSKITKYYQSGGSTDITTSTSKENSYFRSIGKTYSANDQEYVKGDWGAAASTQDHRDRNTSPSSEFNCAGGIVSLGCLKYTNGDEKTFNKAKLEQTRGLIHCSGANIPDIYGYFGTPPVNNAYLNIDSCTIPKLTGDPISQIPFNGSTPTIDTSAGVEKAVPDFKFSFTPETEGGFGLDVNLGERTRSYFYRDLHRVTKLAATDGGAYTWTFGNESTRVAISHLGDMVINSSTILYADEYGLAATAYRGSGAYGVDIDLSNCNMYNRNTNQPNYRNTYTVLVLGSHRMELR